MGEWRHKDKEKNDNTPDPTESAFFSNETVGNISNALVREANQNVLDELKDKIKNSNGPAKVRITLSGNKYALKPQEAKEILANLIPHLQADKNGIIPSELPDFEKPMPFLLYEDFNTNGLEGEPGEYLFKEVNNIEKAHNFYYFWRAYGRSGKLANKMGSWGVGKSVFPAISKVNCFWALTIRESDKEAYLIGQSVLKTHDRLDRPSPCGYFPWGFYGVFDNDNFAMPESSHKEINKFCSLFSLKRIVDDEPKNRETNTGLSIIVPYPKEEVTLESLAISTIKQFFYPILNNKLEVEIQYEDQIVILKKESLKKEVEKLDLTRIPTQDEINKEQLISLFEFAEWTLNIKPEDHIILDSKNPHRAFEWRRELFINCNLIDLQKRFDVGEPLSFIVPVKYQPENSEPELRYFNAYIHKDLSLEEPESTFIRDALTIMGIKSLKRKGSRGLVIISDKHLVTFFGQAEGPAHTGWHKDNFRTRYESVEEIISFVQRSLERLYFFLQLPAEGIDKTLLSDFFSIDIPGADDGSEGGKKKGKKKEMDPKFVPPEQRPKKYNLTKLETESGFKITNSQNLDHIPGIIKLTLAYVRPDGNPIKKYSVFDFDVQDMTLEHNNIEIDKLDGNQVEFTPLGSEFELKITGFDKNRDLMISVN